MNQGIITLDVREDIRSGRSPLSAVLKAVATLRSDESLRLLAPFEPIPMCQLLSRQGFQHAAKPIAGSDWEVLFTRQSSATPTEAKLTVERPAGSDDVGSPPEVIQLDARGLEPPQPLVTILEALGALPIHAELCAHTDRRPMHLYAQLEERGFIGESQEQSDGSFLTHIRHR